MNEIRKWDCYLMDFDFTIADSSRGIVKCFNSAFDLMGLPTCSNDSIRKTIGMSLSEAFVLLQHTSNSIWLDEFNFHFHNLSSKIMVESSVLYRNVSRFLRWSKKHRIATGIVTSKDAFTVKAILRKNDCEEYVDAIIGEDEVAHTKPDAEPLITAMEVLCAKKDSTVFIGDCLIDAEAANNAQVDFVAVLTGCTSKEDFQNCGYPIAETVGSIGQFWYTQSRGEN